MSKEDDKKFRREARRKALLAGPKQRAWRIPDKKKKANKEACRKRGKYDRKSKLAMIFPSPVR